MNHPDKLIDDAAHRAATLWLAQKKIMDAWRADPGNTSSKALMRAAEALQRSQEKPLP